MATWHKMGDRSRFYFLLSDHGELKAPEAREVVGDIRAIYDRLPNGRMLLMFKEQTTSASAPRFWSRANSCGSSCSGLREELKGARAWR